MRIVFGALTLCLMVVGLAAPSSPMKSKKPNPCKATTNVRIIEDSYVFPLEADYIIAIVPDVQATNDVLYDALMRSKPVSAPQDWKLPDRKDVTLDGRVELFRMGTTIPAYRLMFHEENAMSVFSTGKYNSMRYFAKIVLTVTLKKFKVSTYVRYYRVKKPVDTIQCLIELSDDIKVTDWVDRCVNQTKPKNAMPDFIGRLLVGSGVLPLRVVYDEPAAAYYRSEPLPPTIQWQFIKGFPLDTKVIIHDYPMKHEITVPIEIEPNVEYEIEDVANICECSARRMIAGLRSRIAVRADKDLYLEPISANSNKKPERASFEVEEEEGPMVLYWKMKWIATFEFAAQRLVKFKRFDRLIPIFPETTPADIFIYLGVKWPTKKNRPELYETLYLCSDTTEPRPLDEHEPLYEAMWADERAYLAIAGRLPPNSRPPLQQRRTL